MLKGREKHVQRLSVRRGLTPGGLQGLTCTVTRGGTERGEGVTGAGGCFRLERLITKGEKGKRVKIVGEPSGKTVGEEGNRKDPGRPRLVTHKTWVKVLAPALNPGAFPLWPQLCL